MGKRKMARKKPGHYEPVSLKYVLLVTGVVMLVFLAANVQRFVLQNSQLSSVIVPVLVALSNQDREKAQVGTLTVNPTLVAAAQAKADDMAAKGYFAHTSPEGKDSWYWFKEVGYDFVHAGENLAVDFSDSTAVEEAWMNSPTHRANLIDDRFTEIGIAIAHGVYEGRNTTFVVQMFGTPTVAAVHAASEPPTPVVVDNPVGKTRVSEADSINAPSVSTPIVLGTETTLPMVTSETQAQKSETRASTFSYLLSSPKEFMRYSYYLLTLILFFGLITRTGIEIRRHHMHHVALTLALVVLMIITFVATDVFIFTDPAIALTS